MRALCCGDSHIGAGRDLAPDRLHEQEQLWRTVLELARTENVDAVLHAGDMWERRKPSPDEYLAAERPLVEHRDAGGCPVLVCAGNHDRAGVDDNLALRVLEQAGLILLSTEPEVIPLPMSDTIRICTLPWTPVSRLVAVEGCGDRDRIHETAAELLIATARGLRERANGPAILVLHWSVGGAALPSGLPIEMAREVILPIEELVDLGFDQIVAAHIHKKQYIDKTDERRGFYVGSPMPLNFGEAKDAHGVWLLEVGPEGFVSSTFRTLESRRFVTVDVGVGPNRFVFSSIGIDVRDAFVKFQGVAGDEDLAAVRSYFVDELGAARVQFDLTVERPARARVEGLSEDLGAVDALAAYLAAIGVNGSVGAALIQRTQGYLERTGA